MSCHTYIERIKCSITYSAGVMCVIGASGLIGTTMSLYVYTRPAMRSSNSILLAGLCTVDSMLVLLSMLTFGARALTNHGIGSAVYVVVWTYPLLMMALGVATWLRLVISCERFVAVKYPFRALSMFSVRRSIQAICGLFAVSIPYNMVRFWEFRVEVINGTRKARLVENLRSNPDYLYSFATSMFILFHYALPLIGISICNLGTLSHIIRTAASFRSRSRGLRHEHHVARMTLAMVAAFILLNSVPTIMYILEAANPLMFKKPENYGLFIATDAGNVLVVVNSSISVLIFYKMNRRFRRTFNAILPWNQSVPHRGRSSSEWTSHRESSPLRRRKNCYDLGDKRPCSVRHVSAVAKVSASLAITAELQEAPLATVV